MIRKLEVPGPTVRELAAIADWYDRQRAGLGLELNDAVLHTFDVAAERAESFPRSYRGLRRALVDRFPYVVFFAVLPTTVRIIAVLHTSRDHVAALRHRR